MTKKYTYSEKSNGQTLSAEEWNNLAQDVDALVTGVNNGTIGGSSSSSSSIVSAVEDTNATDPTVNVSIASGVTAIGTPDVIQLTKKSKGVNTTVVSGNNINIEPRESTGKEKSTKGGNISLKPGDDIELCSHHRRFGNRDEVTVKVIDGSDNPVKLQLKAGEITLCTEGKSATMTKAENTGLDTSIPLYDNENVMDVNVTTGNGGKGYLKVRAQAIDLRCEEAGGIAIQPNGTDHDGHMNKIKFEHGGGDGLEFGTFNTEHTSLFTEDYRFNKDGEIKLARRKKVYSDKSVKFTCTGALTYSNDNADTYSETQNVSSITAPLDIAAGTNHKYSIFEIAEMFSGLDIEKFQAWLETKSSNDIEIKCTGNMYFQFTENDDFKSHGTNDTTSHYKYVKNSEDDLYDFIDSSDPTCTWEDIVTIIAELKTMKTNNQGPWAGL